ncbi:hypothetical protein ACFLSA_06270 [Bacteroidota bacterium]
MRYIIGFSLLILVYSSCSYDDEETYYQECDTSNVSFSEDIRAIIDANCIFCHSDNYANGGYSYQSYEGVKEALDKGRFLGAIRHENGFRAMPDGQPRMDDCTILKIEVWIVY